MASFLQRIAKKMSLFSSDIGIDLGTATVLVYVKGKGVVLNEPSVVAVDKVSGKILAVGEEAQSMLGRTPGNIVAIRPLREGVISDYEMTERMIKEFIAKVQGIHLFKPNVVICVPSIITEVEERAVIDAGTQAGAKRVFLVEEPVAAAIGAGIDIAKPDGHMVVDIGGGTSEVAVISLGGIVASRSVRVGGDEFDSAIIQYVKKKYNLLIGDRTAENIKIQIGSAYPYEDEQPMEIKGRNLVDGLPKNMMLHPEEVREALADSIMSVLDAIRTTLERTPPELSADIIDHGITLTGGGAMLRGLDQLISKETGMPVQVAENPLDCVAAGTGKLLENLNSMKELLSDDDSKY